VKKLFAVVAAIVAFGFANSANAAPPVAVYDWSGFYAGLNAGYGWARNDGTDVDPVWSPVTSTDGIHPKGGLFGGHVGYNFRLDNSFVAGVEASLNWADINASTASFAGGMTSWSSKVGTLLTFDARLGYAMGLWLPYVKAGYAGARLKDGFFENDGGDISTDSHSIWVNGWNVGVGAEYAITRNWIVGVEYNYMDFGTASWSGINSAAERYNWRDELRISTITARVSYKFSPWGR